MAASKGKTRKEQAVETKNKIYNAAIELLDSGGFENMTIQCISRKAHVSVGSFYHYFNSKLDILTEVFLRADEYFRIEVLPNLKGKDTFDQILFFFRHYALFNISTSLEHARAIYNPKITTFGDKKRLMWVLLENIVSEGQEKGFLTTKESAEDLAEFLFTLARGVTFDWCIHEGQYDLEKKLVNYIRKVLPVLAKIKENKV